MAFLAWFKRNIFFLSSPSVRLSKMSFIVVFSLPLSDWPNNKCYPILGVVVVVWQSRLFRAFFWIEAFQVVAWNESRRGHFVFRLHEQDVPLRLLYFWTWSCTLWCCSIELVRTKTLRVDGWFHRWRQSCGAPKFTQVASGNVLGNHGFRLAVEATSKT